VLAGVFSAMGLSFEVVLTTGVCVTSAVGLAAEGVCVCVCLLQWAWLLKVCGCVSSTVGPAAEGVCVSSAVGLTAEGVCVFCSGPSC
jgi:hypothetical protein